MDIKEAVPAGAPHGSNADIPEDDAVRVVSGACHLSPALGKRMLAARLLDRPVVIRELLPQDLKVEINRLSREEALKAAVISPWRWARLTPSRWTLRPVKNGAQS